MMLLHSETARWKFLAEASVVLDDAPDEDAVRAAALRMVVPRIANVAALWLYTGADRAPVRVGPVGTDPGPTSSVSCVLPLSVRGHVLGALVLGSTCDLSFATEVAQRIAAALDRARRYDRLRAAVREQTAHLAPCMYCHARATG
jgi:hypothetical protein